MKKILFIIMLMITCISFGKNNYGNTDITTEAKECCVLYGAEMENIIKILFFL